MYVKVAHLSVTSHFSDSSKFFSCDPSVPGHPLKFSQEAKKDFPKELAARPSDIKLKHQ